MAKELKVDTVVSEGKVFLVLSKRVDYVGLTPEQARELASDLMEKAKLAEGKTDGKPPPTS